MQFGQMLAQSPEWMLRAVQGHSCDELQVDERDAIFHKLQVCHCVKELDVGVARSWDRQAEEFVLKLLDFFEMSWRF